VRVSSLLGRCIEVLWMCFAEAWTQSVLAVGVGRANGVNRLTAGGANGIQIEQTPPARSNHWRDIADVVADARIAGRSKRFCSAA
jgi:hypothetical protein